jgi:Tol biopolymer transport system component
VRPVWAPDGQTVAFVSVDGSVTLAHAGTGKTLVRQSDEPQSQIVLAGWRDVDTLVYGSRTSAPTSAVYRVTLATGAPKRLVSDAWMPASAPDDSALAFARPPGIWLWDDARGARLLVRTLGSNTTSGLAWSPDGRTIAYSTPSDIGLVALDGSTRPVLTFAHVIRVTAWSPDARWIAYTADDGVWLVHPDGTDNHRFAAQASGLQWSPDGRRVAYLTSSGALVVAGSDNSDARTVATEIEPSSIAWSRDGTQIFATRVVNRWPLGSIFTRLVAVAADGSGETPITDGGGYIAGVAGPGA